MKKVEIYFFRQMHFFFEKIRFDILRLKLFMHNVYLPIQ